MGLFDKIKDKAAQMAGQHGDKAEEGIDKAAEFADEKTGGKHSDKIDTGAQKAKDAMGNLRGDQSGDQGGDPRGDQNRGENA
jgi:antitoxin protein of toxin-antitoxin system